MTPIFAVLMIIAVIISTSLLLILIFSEDKPKKIKKMLSNFDNAVDEFGLSIGKQELIGKRIIGLDKVKNMLLFFSATRNKQEAYFIDLREIKSCEVKREYGLTFNDYSRKNVAATDVDKIALQLFYKNGNSNRAGIWGPRGEADPDDSPPSSAASDPRLPPLGVRPDIHAER